MSGVSRGSGSKNISEDWTSSDRMGEPGIELGTPWYKASDLSTTLRQLTFCGCSLEVVWVYVFVA